MNYWVIVIFEMLDCLGLVFSIEVIFSNIQNVVGWTRGSFYILFGTYYIQAELSSCLFIAGVDSFSEKIKNGALDYYLTKPLSCKYLSLISGISLNKLIPLIVPIFMVCYGCINIGFSFTIVKIMLYLLFLFLGIILYLNVVSIIMAMSFWFIKIGSFINLIFLLFNYAQHPKDIFNKPLTIFFTFIIPIILIANPAAIVLTGGDYKILLGLTLIMNIVTFFFSNYLWNKGLIRYQSASS
jgi:ABC-2 type transport system permease protein